MGIPGSQKINYDGEELDLLEEVIRLPHLQWST